MNRPTPAELVAARDYIAANEPDWDNEKFDEATSVVLAELLWFQSREPLVRALVGAIEDTAGDGCPEWRTLVSWELDV